MRLLNALQLADNESSARNFILLIWILFLQQKINIIRRIAYNNVPSKPENLSRKFYKISSQTTSHRVIAPKDVWIAACGADKNNVLDPPALN